MKQVRKYDIVVIGSGPSGEKAVMQAAKLRKKVVLIEKSSKMGGSCLHTGTIPSKSLRDTVVNLESLKKRTHGIDFTFRKNITIDELMYRKQVVIHEQENSFRRNLSKNHVDTIHGMPRFTSPTTLSVVEEGEHDPIEIQANYAVIATGSRPYRPEFIPFDEVNIFDSDTILDIPHMPKKMTIIGAGVIGSEYACIFAKLGIRVNLIARDREILSFLDKEISESLTYRMRHSRITLRLGETVKEIIKMKDGKIHVCLESGKELPSSTVLVAMGRNANSENLGLEELGVEIGKRGQLKVNEVYQTSVENIYAVGDVIGFPALASTSMSQARIATLHAFGKLDNTKMPNDLPLGIWTIPGVACVGKTEEELTDAHIAYEVGIARFREVARAHILGEQDGSLKLLFDPETLKLLGVHIIGPRATELIHLGQSVMYYDGTIEYFMNAVFNYPTLDEAYRIAALNGLNRLQYESL